MPGLSNEVIKDVLYEDLIVQFRRNPDSFIILAIFASKLTDQLNTVCIYEVWSF